MEGEETMRTERRLLVMRKAQGASEKVQDPFRTAQTPMRPNIPSPFLLGVTRSSEGHI